ncbi:HAMP domain-containing sensor histidine kinase [Embleya hyalina]|uniref:histidine kinase n=1 Tax=Embleya hyalina TaxID=516124 RepID=A0A401YER9_9ACTN|nr:ATP-binding protein [Embleya hyalina]GCD93104.1 two-component sensor histidine kinase [Embleya hyalina]
MSRLRVAGGSGSGGALFRRPSARARLALMYGGVSLVVGAVLLGIVYWFVDRRLSERLPMALARTLAADTSSSPAFVNDSGPLNMGSTRPAQRLPGVEVHGVAIPADAVRRAVDTGQDVTMSQLLTVLVAALLLLAATSILVGWWMSGRVLRPVHKITATARRLSEHNLHERIAMPGPDDELKELADTFDGMLDRLEKSFDSRRLFVANASHELRTPLTIQRTAIEIGLADPHSPTDVVETREQLLALNRRTERLIDGLLDLAVSERGNVRASPVALDELTADVLRQTFPAAEQAGVRVDANLTAGVVSGDPLLLRQLVTNLVENAVRHNHPGGSVTVAVSAGLLRVRNTGPVIPADHVPELFEPFRRFRPDRTGSAKGSGLGLSIVQAIVHAHAALLSATANRHGGLTIAVALPGPSGRTNAPNPSVRPPLESRRHTGFGIGADDSGSRFG